MISILFLSQIVGLNTNVQFLDDLAGHKSFIAGQVHTGFITQHYQDLFPKRILSNDVACRAAIALLLQQQRQTAELSKLGQGRSVIWLVFQSKSSPAMVIFLCRYK